MAIAQLIYETSKLIFYIIGNPKNIFIIIYYTFILSSYVYNYLIKMQITE